MTTDQKKIDISSTVGPKKMVPPDGGWGWVVVFASAFILMFNQSLISTFSLVYGGEIERLSGGIEGAALVANLMFLVLNFSGPFSGHLIKTISYRKVAFFGSLLTGFGLITSSFATAIWHMIVTYSLFTGIGLGMIQSSTFVAVNAYFKVKRGRAVGISLAGAGVGQVLMPHVIKYLLEQYSYRGTTQVIGALCLNGVVGALLLQPVKQHMIEADESIPEKKYLLSKEPQPEKVSDSLKIENETLNPPKVTNAIQDTFKNGHVLDAENEKEPKVSKLKSLVSHLDLKLLKSPRFVTVALGCALAHSSMINFGILLPFFLLEKVNLTMKETAFAMSFLSGADIIGRITVPMITDRYKIRATVGMMIGCGFMAIVRQIMAYQMSYSVILALCTLIGLGKTFIVVNQNLAVSDQCKIDQVPTAIGLYMVTKGIIVLPAGMLIGWVRDYTGSFILSVSVVNIMATVVITLLLPQYIYSRFCEKRATSQIVK